MEDNYINLNSENIATEHLSCLIRTRTLNPGIEAKRKWLTERIKEGHVFRKLNVKGAAFIEYAPLEKAWVPIEGNNFLYIYCLWVDGKDIKGKGHGTELMQYCIDDAKAKGKSGICLLGAKRQKHWLTSQAFAQKYGFEVVDSTDYDYDLYCLSFDGTTPRFTKNSKNGKIDNQELTIYYDDQCPHTNLNIETIKDFCENQKIPLSLIHVDTLQKAKTLPCVFNNWAVFYKGEFQTVNLLLDLNDLVKIIRA